MKKTSIILIVITLAFLTVGLGSIVYMYHNSQKQESVAIEQAVSGYYSEPATPVDPAAVNNFNQTSKGLSKPPIGSPCAKVGSQYQVKTGNGVACVHGGD